MSLEREKLVSGTSKTMKRIEKAWIIVRIIIGDPNPVVDCSRYPIRMGGDQVNSILVA